MNRFLAWCLMILGAAAVVYGVLLLFIGGDDGDVKTDGAESPKRKTDQFQDAKVEEPHKGPAA